MSTDNGGRRTPRRTAHRPDVLPNPLPNLLYAPLSGPQVNLLNRAQNIAADPHLCPFRAQHREPFGEENILVAVTTGMVCPGCDYRQDFAHPTPTLRAAAPVIGPARHTLVMEPMPSVHVG